MAGKTSGRIDRVLLALLALSLLVNIAVVWWFARGRSLAGDRPSIHDVAVGSVLQPLAGVSPSGQTATFTYGEDPRPTVLYVFSFGCSWCQRNLASINLLARTVGVRYRFVGVSLSPLGDGHPMPYVFPVIQPVGSAPFRATPQTIVVASDGRVLRTWTGAYVGRNKQEMEMFFSVQLPEIQVGDNGG